MNSMSGKSKALNPVPTINKSAESLARALGYERSSFGVWGDFKRIFADSYKGIVGPVRMPGASTIGPRELK
ncbi:hypothetical protein EVAR_53145_1 [Eumeta japonica]|uniref:Uncharacterized protein n=1 Tax=Eumeta variegata TaxID=151549 RepID=A0A4C1YE80_EUMVA|nr:hypothetical protein EVAR_53145_1 [Eumeta japonica]